MKKKRERHWRKKGGKEEKEEQKREDIEEEDVWREKEEAGEKWGLLDGGEVDDFNGDPTMIAIGQYKHADGESGVMIQILRGWKHIDPLVRFKGSMDNGIAPMSGNNGCRLVTSTH